MKNKALKFRIYPNKEQRILLAKTFGCTRLVYNYFLALRKELYDESGESMSYNQCTNELTQLNIVRQIRRSSLRQSNLN